MYILAISEEHPHLADFADTAGKKFAAMGLILAVVRGVKMTQARALNVENQLDYSQHWVLWRQSPFDNVKTFDPARLVVEAEMETPQ